MDTSHKLVGEVIERYSDCKNDPQFLAQRIWERSKLKIIKLIGEDGEGLYDMKNLERARRFLKGKIKKVIENLELYSDDVNHLVNQILAEIIMLRDSNKTN